MSTKLKKELLNKQFRAFLLAKGLPITDMSDLAVIYLSDAMEEYAKIRMGENETTTT